MLVVEVVFKGLKLDGGCSGGDGKGGGRDCCCYN